MKKSTITYRFNHKQPEKNTSQEKNNVISLEKDEYQVIEEANSSTIFDRQPLNQYTTDFGGWSSPFDLETEKLEKMIRESSRFQKGERNDDHDPEQDYDYDSVTGYYDRKDHASVGGGSTTRYLRNSRAPWGKIITSVSGAIITGVLFGFFVLSLFTDNSGDVQTTNEGLLNDNASIVTEGGEGNNVTSTGNLDINEVDVFQVDIPAQSYFVLQNGVFSSVEGAEAAQQDLINRGFSAARELSDSYYVFAGISTSRDDALFMSHQLQENNMETYIKPYSIPAIRNLYWKAEQTVEIEAYLAAGNQLTRMISSLAVIYLQKTSPQSIDNTSMESLIETHQTWSALASQIAGGTPEQLTQTFQKLNNSMNTAVRSLETYQKNPSFSYLWQSQTSLMEYILLQKELLIKLTAH